MLQVKDRGLSRVTRLKTEFLARPFGVDHEAIAKQIEKSWRKCREVA